MFEKLFGAPRPTLDDEPLDSLASFERDLLSCIASQHHKNLDFFCLRDHLQGMLPFHRRRRLGEPAWLCRRWDDMRIWITMPSRIAPGVRAWRPAPWLPFSATFPFTTETGRLGAVAIEMTDVARISIAGFREQEVARRYPEAGHVRVLWGDMVDETSYWTGVRSRCPQDLCRLFDVVLEALERGTFERDVVIPAKITWDRPVWGIEIAGTYKVLLGLCNGITVNGLCLHSYSSSNASSIVEGQGGTLLALGFDDDFEYYLAVRGHCATERLLRSRSGSLELESVAGNIFDLCLDRLKP